MPTGRVQCCDHARAAHAFDVNVCSPAIAVICHVRPRRVGRAEIWLLELRCGRLWGGADF